MLPSSPLPMGNPVRAEGVASMRTSPFWPRFGLFNLGTAVVVVRWARCGRCGASAQAAQPSSAAARMVCSTPLQQQGDVIKRGFFLRSAAPHNGRAKERVATPSGRVWREHELFFVSAAAHTRTKFRK